MLSKLLSHWTDIAALALIVAVFCFDIRFGLRFGRDKEAQRVSSTESFVAVGGSHHLCRLFHCAGVDFDLCRGH